MNPGIFPEHPRATIPDNDVTFRYARTGERPDRVVAHDEGGDIATGVGSDRLIGGRSTDFLRGGEGDDRMTGNGGRDGFLYSVGDGNDTVTDFRAGNGGDVIALFGTAYENAGQLTGSFEGGDTILSLGLDASIRSEERRVGKD